MTDERREAQASLYVLGALPAEELVEFEAALRADLQLQLLVKELRGTAGAMVAAFPRVAPPPALKQRLFAALDQREAPSARVVPLEADGASAWMGWMPWALAACFAILCVVLIAIGQSLRQQALGLSERLNQRDEETDDLKRQVDLLQFQVDQQTTNYQTRIVEVQKQVLQRIADLSRQTAEVTNRLQQQQAESQRRLAFYRNQSDQLARQKKILEEALAGTTTGDQESLASARLAVLRPTTDGPAGALGASLWSPQDQRGLIVLESLPPLPPTQSYQLWLIDPKLRSPVSGGVLPIPAAGSVRIQFTVELRVDSAERFAITIEPRGGAAAPTGKTVLASN